MPDQPPAASNLTDRVRCSVLRIFDRRARLTDGMNFPAGGRLARLARMRKFFASLGLLTVLLDAGALPARAEIGPCRPEAHDGLICGSGAGAARIIDGTLSPDKRLAFAWRAAKSPPTEEPDDNEEVELLLVRLADGAILARRPTGYWATGTLHVNRLQEQALWAADGSFVVRAFQARFDTPTLEVFAIGTGAKVAGPVNLRALIEPAVRAHWKGARPYEDYVFSVGFDENAKISNSGELRFPLLMFVPKDGPEENYDVVMQVTRTPSGLRAGIPALTPRPDKN
jgi:hypothetical protein